MCCSGSWLYFPPSEYIIGGKDPGTYINEGIQIAQRGQVIVRDPDMAARARAVRDLFFPSHQQDTYYGLRFMGFFIQDPDDGTVIGQFPHLYPASIAIGYGLNGLSGARQAVGSGRSSDCSRCTSRAARLFGHAAASPRRLCWRINIVEVWFGRYPNSEMAMQALIFAALLAAGRARDGGARSSASSPARCSGCSLFLRYEILLAFAAFAAAGVLAPVTRADGWLAVPGGARSSRTAAGLWYLAGPMRAYFAYPLGFLQAARGLCSWPCGIVAAVGGSSIVRRPGIAELVRRGCRWSSAIALAGLGDLRLFLPADGGPHRAR